MSCNGWMAHLSTSFNDGFQQSAEPEGESISFFFIFNIYFLVCIIEIRFVLSDFPCGFVPSPSSDDFDPYARGAAAAAAAAAAEAAVDNRSAAAATAGLDVANNAASSRAVCARLAAAAAWAVAIFIRTSAACWAYVAASRCQ